MDIKMVGFTQTRDIKVVHDADSPKDILNFEGGDVHRFLVLEFPSGELLSVEVEDKAAFDRAVTEFAKETGA